MARRVTLPRYMALRRHWAMHPRPEWLIAGYLGYKPKAEPIIARGGSSAKPVRSFAKRPPVTPPTGAMQSLFTQFGGKPGSFAVVSP